MTSHGAGYLEEDFLKTENSRCKHPEVEETEFDEFEKWPAANTLSQDRSLVPTKRTWDGTDFGF